MSVIDVKCEVHDCLTIMNFLLKKNSNNNNDNQNI